MIQTSYKKRKSPLCQLNSHSLPNDEAEPTVPQDTCSRTAEITQSCEGNTCLSLKTGRESNIQAPFQYSFRFEIMLQNRHEKKAPPFTYLEKDYCRVYSSKYWHLDDNPKIWGLCTCGVSYTNNSVTILCTNVKLPAVWGFIKRLNWKPETKLDHQII